MEPTNPQPNSTIWARRVDNLRLRRLSVTIGLTAMLLVGCSTGSAPEAEQGKRQDQGRESVISDMQATRTWDLINGTPESTPEETPEP